MASVCRQASCQSSRTPTFTALIARQSCHLPSA
jgi:hypothetical protein